ncbi:MAG: STT3 domain-containing protein, partial [Candidatus Bathyarchaeota archaeon]|jgi:dolichyl-diphosphooligosaccharide--protein glycosyltransferase
MDAYDPLFQLRVTKYIVENGYQAWFNWHDTLSWYPWGRNIPRTSFPGVPFTGALAYFAARALGLQVTVDTVCLYFPVLIGALTCVVVYFLGRDLGGSSTGLIGAFFMAISESFIGRTALGFYDTENIGIFGMTMTVFFFLRSLDNDRSQTWRILYAIATGLSLGYIFASWGASRYIVGLLALFVLISLVTGKFEIRHLVSYGTTLGVGYIIASFVPKLGVRYLTSAENVASILLVLLMIVYETVRRRIGERQTVLLIGGLVVALVVGVLALSALGMITPIKGKFLRVLNPFQADLSPLSESVAEHKRGIWSGFFGSYGLTLPLAMLGAYFAINSLNDIRLFYSLYFVTAIYFTGSMTRLELILSVPVSVMAAYGVTGLLTPFVSASRVREERGRRRRRVARLGVSKELALVFTVFILVGLLPTIWGTADASLRPTALASSGVPALLGERYPQDWLQALSWMRDNLPDEAVVVSWWDYGYWIEEVAGKTTLADGATFNRSQISYIGRIMMLNQSESLPLLEAYDATHIVVFNTFYPGNPEQQWPFGDNVKWQWMVEIPGLNISEYLDETGRPAGKYQESTLYNLMNLTPGPGFNPVYVSDFRYVLVYEIDYKAS